MNKSILSAILFCFITSNLVAQNQDIQTSFKQIQGFTEFHQETETKESQKKELFVGLIFAPFAVTTFEGRPPFSTDSSLFLTAVVAKGDWAFAPYYNFSSDSAGAFVTYTISNELGAYVASDKALTGNTGTYALGLTTPILEGYIQGYVEIGGTYGDNATPFLGIGLYFNVLKSVKSW